MDIGKRIGYARKMKGLNQTELAEMIGISMGGLSQIERGKVNPSKQTIELICNKLSINKVWLETGEGDMSLPSTDPIAEIVSDVLENGQDNPFYKSILKAVKLYQSLSLRDREYIDDLIDRLIEEQKNDPE